MNEKEVRPLDLDLSKIDEGAVQEKFEHEMEKVIENILDRNTNPTKKRSITITIDVLPSKDRDMFVLATQTKSKLVPREETETKVLFGRNEDTGMLEAAELKSNARGQMFIDPDDLKVKTDTGQPVEELEKKENEIVDFRKRQSN
ncbi:hypothetical protein [Enterococcus casseliflavus]|uniref:hypothetical protein n=1 Tax=Enterococcus casseliflavus TaxID=37734 RepID=UPI002DBAE6E0|nr:hypothetical protein [Enterococcus casseliflavus]MEB6147372.1 hypothetical protein [Enterococcus casseliflavus]